MYTFARTGDPARTQTAKLTGDGAAGDTFGWSVAVDGDTIAAGALEDDMGANTDQGSAIVFFAPAPAPDTSAPNTKGLRGPKKVEKSEVAKFRFASSEPGSSFRCKVDKKSSKPCTSPYEVKPRSL